MKTQAIIFPFNKSHKRVPTLQLSFEGTVPIYNNGKYLVIFLQTLYTSTKKLKFITFFYTCNKHFKQKRNKNLIPIKKKIKYNLNI